MNFRFFQKRNIFIVAAIIILIGAFAFRNYTQYSSSPKISKTAVKLGNLEEKVTISGTISAQEKITLRFQTSGRLSWVGVKEGDYVKKYQSIAVLDQREVKKKLESELNDYLKTRWDFDEAKKDTYKDKAVTDSIKRILEKNQFDLNKSILDVELQDLSIEFANLWTPIEGIVTKVGSPYGGTNITPSSAEFEIVNPKTIYFSATADQTEVTSFYKDMKGNLTLDSYPDATYSGWIKDISFAPKSGETSTVYEVKFTFENDNSDYKFRLGMAGDVTFITKSKENVLHVPNKFLSTKNGKKYVTVDINGKHSKQEVTTGMETESDTEILSGVAEGQTIYDEK